MPNLSWLENLKASWKRFWAKDQENSGQTLRFDGLYFSFNDDVEFPQVGDVKARSIPSSSFLKFYEDGLVILAVVSCRNISEDIPQVIKWFNRDWEEASSTRFQQADNKLQFCFDDRLVFNGQILANGTIRFKVHNRGNDKKWKEQFAFWPE
jgi:hypothetical protein